MTAITEAVAIARAHAEFCRHEADRGGSPDLRERAKGADYIAERIARLGNAEALALPAVARLVAQSRQTMNLDDYPDWLVYVERAEKMLDDMGFRYCQVCGCSDDDACAGGCAWVTDELLCTTCARQQQVRA